MVPPSRLAPLLVTLWLTSACGAKTGLLIPDADPDPDAGMDAGIDAGTDAGTDAGRCMPSPVVLERRGAQVLFAVDRSNSMNDTLTGATRPPGDPRPSRWEVLADVLGDVLLPEDPLLEIGGKFYPGFPDEPPMTAAEACNVDPGIDLRPGPNNAGRLLRFFTDTGPSGGTPTAVGLEQVREFFENNPSFVPRTVVLATDGGPNCNPDIGIPPEACVCTGSPEACLPPTRDDIRVSNCLDADRTFEVVRRLFTDLEVPVYVIGIDDPGRPDLADVLDEMAILGGRPRDEAMGRRFYSIRDTDDLRGALTEITESISQCVFTMAPRPGAADDLEVVIGGVQIPRDASRSEGWDFTRADRSELTLFGGACERVAIAGGDVEVEITCPPE